MRKKILIIIFFIFYINRILFCEDIKNKINDVKSKESDMKKSSINDAGEYPDANIKFYHFDNKLYQVKFKYPKDWLLEKIEIDKDVIVIKDNTSKTVILLYLLLGYKDSLEEQIVKKQKSIKEEYFPGLIEDSAYEKTVISGRNAFKTNYKGYLFSQEAPFLGEMITTLDPGESYSLIVFLAADLNNFTEARKMFYLIINSFKITDSQIAFKSIFSKLAGSWIYENSDFAFKVESSITFFGDETFQQTKDDLCYFNPSYNFDEIFNSYNPKENNLNKTGKYKLLGDILYLFYNDGTIAEFILTFENETMIKLNNIIFKKKE